MNTYKLTVRTKATGKLAMIFYVKGASMLEAVDYATDNLVAPLLEIDYAIKCESNEEIPAGTEIYPTEITVNDWRYRNGIAE